MERIEGSVDDVRGHPYRAPALMLAIGAFDHHPRYGPSAGMRCEDADLVVDQMHIREYRWIAHIAGPQNVDTARRRRRGFVNAMAEHGLDVLPGSIVEAQFSELGGATAASALLDLTPRPTAIVAANAVAAVGAMAAVRGAGLTIPADVSIIGFHDIPQAAYLEPALTTVQMPLAELGSRSVDMLLAMIGGAPGADITVASPPELILRGSCAPPAAP